jgi:hypothetical protein
MPEFLPGILTVVAGLAMIALRDTVALLQASAVGLVLGMSNARKLIPILKIEVLVGGFIFTGIGIYSVFRLL